MAKINVGDIVEGKVENLTDFGAFVELKTNGRTGLIHISEIADKYVKDISKYLSAGDEIRVKIINIDTKKNRIGLSWKEVPKDKRKLKTINGSQFLPNDTREVLGEAIVENFHLTANRYLDRFESQSKFDRKAIFQNIKNKARNIFKNDLYEKINLRQKEQIDSLKESGFFVKSFEMTNDYRIVPGLGGVNVLETNLSLHNIYGVPYIPGSSLKGLAKSFAIEKLRDDLDLSYDKLDDLLKKEEIDEYEEELKIYREIFGTQKSSGKVNFMEAFPKGKIKIKIDIMTPHYKDYYSEMGADHPTKMPTDNQEPTPLPFLVLEGQKFQFNLISDQEDVLNKAYSLLNSGLKYLGIGAKTMIGYGYFE